MNINEPIIWTGELNDDCTARWNGLILRAEWMDEDIWWWAVSKDNNDPMDEIDSSNNYKITCIGGEQARQFAEQAAKKFIQEKIQETIQKIISIPNDFHRVQTKSWNTLLQESGYFELYENITESEIINGLVSNPDTILQWLQWSDDQRTSSACSFSKRGNSDYFVGRYPTGKEFIELITPNEFQACAYFIIQNIESTRKRLRDD